MELINSRGIKSPIWQAGELLTNSDINEISESRYQLVSDMFAILSDETNNVSRILGGLRIDPKSGLTLELKSGSAVSFEGYYDEEDLDFEFVSNAGSAFSVVVPNSQDVTINTPDSTNDRVDIIEIRPSKVVYESEKRRFRDPITGTYSTAFVPTKVSYQSEVQVIDGTPGSSPVAPNSTAGWIKVAEVTVPAGVNSIVDDNIVGGRDSILWTTESKSVGEAKLATSGAKNVVYLSQFSTLQGAIDYISNTYVTGTVYVDEDRDVTQEITDAGQPIQLRTGINIIGTGGQQAKITTTNESYHHFSGTDAERFTMKNLDLVGPGLNAAGGGGILLNKSALQNLAYLVFENMTIEDVANDGIFINTPILTAFRNVLVLRAAGHCFNVYGGTSTNFYECYALTSVQTGFYLDTMTYCSLNGCAAEVNGVAFYLNLGRNITFSGCGVEDILNRSASYPGYGWYINGENNVLTSCYSRNTASNAIQIENSATVGTTIISFRSLDTSGTYSLDNTSAGSTTLIENSFDKPLNLNSSTRIISGSESLDTGGSSIDMLAASQVYSGELVSVSRSQDGYVNPISSGAESNYLPDLQNVQKEYSDGFIFNTTVFNSGSTNYVASVALDNGNVLIAYASVGGNLRVLDPDGNEVVSETQFSTAVVTHIAVSKLNSGDVVIAYEAGSSGELVIYDQLGNEVVAPTGFTPNALSDAASAPLDNGNVMITYRDNDNAQQGTLVVYDSSGTEVVAPKVFASSTIQSPAPCSLNNGNVLIAYRDNDAGAGRYAIFDQSGTQITLTTDFRSQTNVTGVSTVSIDSGGALIAFKNFDDSVGEFLIVDSGGNILQDVTEYSHGEAEDVHMAILSDGNVMIVYRDASNNSYGTFTIYDESGYRLVSPTAFNAVTTYYPIPAVANRGDVVIPYRDLDNSGYGYFVRINTNEVVKQLYAPIGMSESDASADESVKIILNSSDKQSGLTVGRNYYLQQDGSIGENNTFIWVGRALSSTRLLLG